MLKTEINKINEDLTERTELINSKGVTCETLTHSCLSHQKLKLAFLVSWY